MNTLKALRKEIGLQLAAAGITCLEFIPERLGSVPAAVIEPGSPYLQQGETFSELDFLYRFDVILLVAGTNETATDSLDQLICDAIDAMDTFQIESVNQPEMVSIGNVDYPGARVTVLTQRELEI